MVYWVMDFDNPFAKETIDAVALGPFAKTTPMTQDIPLAEGLGFTPDEVRRQMEKVPGFADALDHPEAETLKQYLGGEEYDMSVLNRLVVDLTDAVARTGRSPKGLEAPGTQARPVSVHSVGSSPMLPEDPEPGLRVRDTGPWWLSS